MHQEICFLHLYSPCQIRCGFYSGFVYLSTAALSTTELFVSLLYTVGIHPNLSKTLHLLPEISQFDRDNLMKAHVSQSQPTHSTISQSVCLSWHVFRCQDRQTVHLIYLVFTRQIRCTSSFRVRVLFVCSANKHLQQHNVTASQHVFTEFTSTGLSESSEMKYHILWFSFDSPKDVADHSSASFA